MNPLAHSSNNCKTIHHAVHDTLDVVGGKWKLIILALLHERPYRFKEMCREIGISPRVLSKELQELEQNQLLTRTVCNTRPITVEYAATPYCQTLHHVIGALRDWGLEHHRTIVGAPRLGMAEPVG